MVEWPCSVRIWLLVYGPVALEPPAAAEARHMKNTIYIFLIFIKIREKAKFVVVAQENTGNHQEFFIGILS